MLETVDIFETQLPTYVTTDASDLVVYLVHSANTEDVFVFAAQILPPAERKYSAFLWKHLNELLENVSVGELCTLCRKLLQS